MGQRIHQHLECCMRRHACALPVALGDRDFRGDLDIRIDAQGVWHYNHAPITRDDWVRAMADMLVRDLQGGYWLVTPTEVGRIEVEDAPLLAVDFLITGAGHEQRVNFLTNADQVITATATSPLVMKPSPVSAKTMPYLIDETGVEAKLTRETYYSLVELGAVQRTDNNDGPFGVWSGGVFFPLIFPVGACFNTDA